MTKLGANALYRELTTRNAHFVSPPIQRSIRGMRVLVAGCGSGGGACIEPLARLGVTHFRLADNGSYEISNLNRQRAYLADVGTPKAAFHAGRLRALNPHVDVAVHLEGIDRRNVSALARWADLVLDCVDVTTPAGIDAKCLLHEAAFRWRRPVLTMLDLGWRQWGTAFDYRGPARDRLLRRVSRARRARHPIAALFALVPLGSVPAHGLEMIHDLLVDVATPASQLAAASDLLSCVAAAAVVRLATDGVLVSGWSVDLSTLALTPAAAARAAEAAPGWRRRIRFLLDRERGAAQENARVRDRPSENSRKRTIRPRRISKTSTHSK